MSPRFFLQVIAGCVAALLFVVCGASDEAIPEPRALVRGIEPGVPAAAGVGPQSLWVPAGRRDVVRVGGRPVLMGRLVLAGIHWRLSQPFPRSVAPLMIPAQPQRAFLVAAREALPVPGPPGAFAILRGDPQRLAAWLERADDDALFLLRPDPWPARAGLRGELEAGGAFEVSLGAGAWEVRTPDGLRRVPARDRRVLLLRRWMFGAREGGQRLALRTGGARTELLLDHELLWAGGAASQDLEIEGLRVDGVVPLRAYEGILDPAETSWTTGTLEHPAGPTRVRLYRHVLWLDYELEATLSDGERLVVAYVDSRSYAVVACASDGSLHLDSIREGRRVEARTVAGSTCPRVTVRVRPGRIEASGASLERVAALGRFGVLAEDPGGLRLRARAPASTDRPDRVAAREDRLR